MKRVTLGYAWNGHQPNETIEVPTAVARQLIHDGKARRADDEVAAERDAAERDAAEQAPPPPATPPNLLGAMTVAELHEHARARGLEIPDELTTRGELIAAIAHAERRPRAVSADPDDVSPAVEQLKFEKMTLSELRAFAAAHEIVIPDDVRKRPAIAEHVRAEWTRDHDAPPAPGTNTKEA